jgi:hypothetical protein
MIRSAPSAPPIVVARPRLRARDVLRHLPLDPAPVVVPAPRDAQEQVTREG